jgi:orotate phosphoribosyltransferase
MDDVLEHFRRTGALLEGHFALSSGLHSPVYLQCALALQDTADASRFGDAMAAGFADKRIDAVASPAIGGIVIGLAVARALGVRFIWTERSEGVMMLRRGFSVDRGERFLIVEDVITTGGSTRECIAAVSAAGEASVIAAAAVIDRSNGRADVGVPIRSLSRIEARAYAPDECPLCRAGTPVEKPGSRK